MQHVDRVLDVRQGDLCWIVGTVYLDMPLKPNILDDISKDHWIAAPPPREKYTSPDGSDKVMLEDESGRLRLIGGLLNDVTLVTGCIIAVMGTENANGDFEIIDMRLPDLPAQLPRWSTEQAVKSKTQAPATQSAGANKIALVSGLEFTGNDGDTLPNELLLEYLLGETSTPSAQKSAAHISRLVVLGNSLAESAPVPANDESSAPDKKKATAASGKKYGYDASTYNPAPTHQLDAFLAQLLPSLPVTLLPGPSDPANVSMPQQPLHPALFPQSRVYSDLPPAPAADAGSSTGGPGVKKPKAPPQHPLHCATNPLFASLDGNLALLSAGQPTADMAKYLPLDPTAPEPSTLDLAAATLRWRLVAPTAPDTLWCYPYQTGDPFVLADGRCPRLYAVGNAKDGFATRVLRGDGQEEAQEVRLVAVPSFKQTGLVVLVDADDLTVSVTRICVHGT